jgi:hypothetical protein
MGTMINEKDLRRRATDFTDRSLIVALSDRDRAQLARLCGEMTGKRANLHGPRRGQPVSSGPVARWVKARRKKRRSQVARCKWNKAVALGAGQGVSHE